MALSGVEEMVPASEAAANLHLVTWNMPNAEAAGMAAAIVKNIQANPDDRHLVMVTRRQFGYWLRDKIAELDPNLRVELGFSEGLLESWAAREAFVLFSLLIDADRPTWRAWLGYKNTATGKEFAAPKRNASAYLKLLKDAKDAITASTIEGLDAEPRNKSRGAGGIIWDRAKRFLDLREKFDWNGEDAAGFVSTLFDPAHWIGGDYDEENVEGASLDLQLLRDKTLALLKQEEERKPAPTISTAGLAGSRARRMRCPTAWARGKSLRASVALTIAIGERRASSSHAKSRPCRRATPTVSKRRGETISVSPSTPSERSAASARANRSGGRGKLKNEGKFTENAADSAPRI
jgi:hypothetical protein